MYNFYRSIRKQAAVSPALKTAGIAAATGTATALGTKALSKLLDSADRTANDLIVQPVVDTTKKMTGSGVKIALATIPLAALSTAYLAAAITSPKAQAEAAEDMVINAVERESLATSMRDLEELRRANRLSANKLRIHDQFI